MNYMISEKRLLELLACEARLEALDAAGVDNWEGADEANYVVPNRVGSQYPRVEFKHRPKTPDEVAASVGDDFA